MSQAHPRSRAPTPRGLHTTPSLTCVIVLTSRRRGPDGSPRVMVLHIPGAGRLPGCLRWLRQQQGWWASTVKRCSRSSPAWPGLLMGLLRGCSTLREVKGGCTSPSGPNGTDVGMTVGGVPPLRDLPTVGQPFRLHRKATLKPPEPSGIPPPAAAVLEAVRHARL